MIWLTPDAFSACLRDVFVLDRRLVHPYEIEDSSIPHDPIEETYYHRRTGHLATLHMPSIDTLGFQIRRGTNIRYGIKRAFRPSCGAEQLPGFP